MNQGFTIWLTGLPGSGKTTIARLLEANLERLSSDNPIYVEVLDGDEVRRNLSPDLGFTKEDREIHAGRVAYISKLLSRNGVIAIVALISPYRTFRENARKLIGTFIEVYVKCSLNTCIERDPKGLYKQSMKGEISNLTGIQDDYEEPSNPEVIVNTEEESPEESVKKILEALTKRSLLMEA